MSKQNGSSGLAPDTVIEKTWQGIPGYILCFPVGISLSSKGATEREQVIALTAQERTERLLDFRMRTVADVLTSPPYMYSLDRLDTALTDKVKRITEETLLTMPDRSEEEREARAKARTEVREKTKLSIEEVEEIKESFPNWPDAPGQELHEVAYEYFNQEDGRGRKIFQLLVEEVISEYWVWATPRPTISVSVFMQDR